MRRYEMIKRLNHDAMMKFLEVYNQIWQLPISIFFISISRYRKSLHDMTIWPTQKTMLLDYVESYLALFKISFLTEFLLFSDNVFLGHFLSRQTRSHKEVSRHQHYV